MRERARAIGRARLEAFVIVHQLRCDFHVVVFLSIPFRLIDVNSF